MAALAREVPTGDLPDVTRALSREVACNRPGEEDRDGKFLDYIALTAAIMKVTAASLRQRTFFGKHFSRSVPNP